MTPDTTSEAPLRTHVFTTPLREFGTEGKHWSPCASTLVTGETDAVLADTGHIKSEVSALGDMIEQTGKQLTTIYITHGHLDHFLGIGQLIKRFEVIVPSETNYCSSGANVPTDEPNDLDLTRGLQESSLVSAARAGALLA